MWQEVVNYFTKELLGLDGKIEAVVNFFIYDSVKILFLLLVIIFAISLLRSYFDTDKVRLYLQGKSEFRGNILAALFGIVTPFCSCSAIPLFLGFLQARIPLGVTFSFLISSPLNNEIAIAMLFTLFGWKITALYIGFGLLVAIFGGWLIGKLALKDALLIEVKPLDTKIEVAKQESSFKKHLQEAWHNTKEIVDKIWLYVLLGVALGAFIHGVVPTDFIAKYTSSDNPFAPLIAVLLGVPMYSNAAGVIPLIEVLTQKGMALGTALSFMMAVTALSLPEAMILKKILSTKLIVIFFSIVAISIVIVGYLFNFILT